MASTATREPPVTTFTFGPAITPFSENQCEVRTTPLRAFNANVAILYVILAVVALVVTWFNSRKIGASPFDSNVYRLVGNYYSDNTVTPPATVASLVNLTPHGLSLVLFAALMLGSLFHFIYALDIRRLYTLLLVDRCNGMRWAQFAIIHTLLAIVVAQMLGTTTFEFLWLVLFAFPLIGILGYFNDRSYPCSPCLSNVAILGTGLIMLAYWVPVITNFTYRFIDSNMAPPVYMWIAMIGLFLFDLMIFVAPWIQSRQRLSYFVFEMLHTIALLIISIIVLVCVIWALADQKNL